MIRCACGEALRHTFTSAHNAVTFGEKDAILAGSELLARSETKWMSLYRCRACGTLWAEACRAAGHIDVYYLFPAPPTADPVRWLHEQAAEL